MWLYFGRLREIGLDGSEGRPDGKQETKLKHGSQGHLNGARKVLSGKWSSPSRRPYLVLGFRSLCFAKKN